MSTGLTAALAGCLVLGTACHREAARTAADATLAAAAPVRPIPAAPFPAPTAPPARPGRVIGLDTRGLDPNDARVVTTVESRLARSGHVFEAHRIPIEQMPAEVRTAGADLEVTYVGRDVSMEVIVLVLRDPATARAMMPVLGRKAIPSSTWVVATWSGRGVLALVSDVGEDGAAGDDLVRGVVAALSTPG